MDGNRNIIFTIGGMTFEYDEYKNRQNIAKHSLTFRDAARVFFDYYRIEYFDKENSVFETRYITIGDLSAISSTPVRIDENVIFTLRGNHIIIVIYTIRTKIDKSGNKIDVIRIISARYATKFERGIYYANF